MRFFTSLALCGTLLVGTADAMVQRGCYEPRAPYVTLRAPELPLCYRLGRNCSNLDRYAWQSSVRDYQQSLRDYADQVERYYRDARTYIECMSRIG